MNEILNTISARRSVRRFKDEMPPKAELTLIAKAGTEAASGMNRQESVVLVIRDKQTRDKLSQLNAKVLGKDDVDPFYGAPAVMVVLADKTVPTYLYDGSLVMGNMMLAATGMNLGSCWIHRAKECFETEYGKGILRDLGIKGDFEGIGFLAVGYIDGEEPEARPRKENRIFYI
ncbi:MAG TPA: diguanylate cyclase [Lachnospiraceae bacterium]|nr:diguanylate cyclase [Lachnospiraceae bacterium]